MAGKDYNIAKKTVQDEILDAVRNVAQQEDVQDILVKVEDVQKIASIQKQYAYTNTSTSSVTPVSVTGKGRLYWFNIYTRAMKSVYPTVNVIVDGNTILSATLYISSSTNTAIYCSATNSDDLTGQFSEGAYVKFKGTSIYTYCSLSAKELAKDSRISVTSNGSAQRSDDLNYYISGYIEFEESLQITMTNCYTGSATECHVCYSLL